MSPAPGKKHKIRPDHAKDKGGGGILAKKPAVLYPYPAVQYIPLLLTKISEGEWTPPPGLNRPALLVGQNDPKWRELLRQCYGLTMPPLTLGSGEVLLLVVNMRLCELKYRGNFATGLAAPSPGRHELYRLNQRVFYKDRVIFEIFAEDGTRLVWQPWDRHPAQAGRDQSRASVARQVLSPRRLPHPG